MQRSIAPQAYRQYVTARDAYNSTNNRTASADLK